MAQFTFSQRRICWCRSEKKTSAVAVVDGDNWYKFYQITIKLKCKLRKLSFYVRDDLARTALGVSLRISKFSLNKNNETMSGLKIQICWQFQTKFNDDFEVNESVTEKILPISDSSTERHLDFNRSTTNSLIFSDRKSSERWKKLHQRRMLRQRALLNVNPGDGETFLLDSKANLF